MEKSYDPAHVEPKIYKMWEDGGYFKPKINKKKKPFTILLPLPNANDPMHMGHALFTVQDILIRYHRMKGDPTLWLPGGDHAGIETQFVFEKNLSKQGKSRFDYDRNTLYKMIEEFVEKNKNINRDQLKRLGFSLDWTRYCYSLNPKIIDIVFETFKNLHKDGLLYKALRLVNFCTKCGTGLSDLEIKHVEKKDPLYYIKYGPFVLATVRPETKFGDTAVAVNPKDKRHKKWVGKTIKVEGLAGPFTVKVIEDYDIDPDFGTGIAKVTPSHDMKDFAIAQRHNLPLKQVIGFDGKLTDACGKYAGLSAVNARVEVVKDLKDKGLLDHVDHDYTHTVATCYKCGAVLEPLPLPQWYVKTQPLARAAISAVKKGKIKIIPKKRFEKMYFDWLNNVQDWNISRQIVWGPRIPAWFCVDCNGDIIVSFINESGKKISGKYKDVSKAHSFAEIAKGLQNLTAPINATYALDGSSCPKCGSSHILQETDTFDTWFLSGQWPYTTLLTQSCADFDYFYPTSVLDTMWDILFFWVARMIMLGLYKTGDVPFKIVHIHSRVVDKYGKKMSKSRGNVINPIDLVDKYGADALRFALIFGAAPGGDVSISEDKVRGMRNFANKLWNICRFLNLHIQNSKFKIQNLYDKGMYANLEDKNKQIIDDLQKLIFSVTKDLESFRLSDASQKLYEFTWHRFADKYIEENKNKLQNNDLQTLAVLIHVFRELVKLIHPFMPFITEKLWNRLPRKYSDLLIISSWPI